MPSSAISQPRLSTPTLVKSMFNSSGLSLALVRDYIFSFHTNMILYFLLQTIFYICSCLGNIEYYSKQI